MRRAWRAMPLTLALLAAIHAAPAAGEAVETRLALSLAEDGSHAAAAVEYRRAALRVPDAAARAAHLWAAAYEYWLAGKPKLTLRMLDLAEETSPILLTESLLLRAEAGLSQDAGPEAAFFYTEVRNAAGESDAKAYAARRLARIALAQSGPDDSLDELAASPLDETRRSAAIRDYAAGRDKSPRIGGLLGLVPGLGYAYSGEYANALRSLMLNGIFLFAMADTAADDEWGAFTAAAFFELTWYTGSVYGGADAAHRYNRDRLQDCVERIDPHPFAAELGALPVVTLRFSFD